MAYMAQRVAGFGTTIFTEMTALANEYEAVNLGQGFPDFAAPDFLKEAAIAAIQGDVNQYAPANGRPSLRQAIAQKMKRHYGRSLDPHTEILVTHGATEAIYATVMGLVNPGDEVIIFEPYYDSYVPSVQMAGGIPRYYTLRPPHWAIDETELVALFSDKTKLILLNTPHNPTGKVYSREELEMIARLCQKYDVIAMSDEVYEHIVFDGRSHHQIAAISGMAERSVTISSLGKTFSATGWKVGWAVAAPHLVQAIFRAHQFVTFSGAAPLQEATAVALLTADDYYTNLAADYQMKRDFLAQALQKGGLPVLPCYGTYFLMVDISHLDFANDVVFCRYLTKEVGVAAIPPSAFYQNPQDGAGLARFAFCKKMETLVTAVARLAKLNL
jgi:N-succinyldiaminopimelate aminotransferase